MSLGRAAIRGAMLLSSLLALSGCAVLTDFSGRSVATVYAARPQARSQLIKDSIQDVRRKVRAIADAAGWEVFRELPDDGLVVYHQIPGAVDATQLGVFCTPAEGGVLVEVSCLSVFCRDSAARALFGRLQ